MSGSCALYLRKMICMNIARGFENGSRGLGNTETQKSKKIHVFPYFSMRKRAFVNVIINRVL